MKKENDLFDIFKNAIIIYFILVQIEWLFWFTVGLFMRGTAVKHWTILLLTILIYYFFLKDLFHI